MLAPRRAPCILHSSVLIRSTLFRNVLAPLPPARAFLVWELQSLQFAIRRILAAVGSEIKVIRR